MLKDLCVCHNFVCIYTSKLDSVYSGDYCLLNSAYRRTTENDAPHIVNIAVRDVMTCYCCVLNVDLHNNSKSRNVWGCDINRTITFLSVRMSTCGYVDVSVPPPQSFFVNDESLLSIVACS